MVGAAPGARLLLVGGSGGLVGRALLPELVGEYDVRSIHRHAVTAEATAGIAWIPADVGGIAEWGPIVRDVDVVVNLAWHRWGNATRFRRLQAGLSRLVVASRASGVRRFVHVSVPEAPPRLEARLPYLAYKRRFDGELARSGLSFRIVRPTMLYGTGDRLLSVLLRLIDRYGLLPMFGDGSYHVSPLAASDLAEIIRRESAGSSTGTIDVGGPERWRYRDLTDLAFRVVGRTPRYVRLGPRASVAFAQLVQDLGSTLLYAYEVEWLLSDRLGLPPYEGLDRPMLRVEPFLRAEIARRRSRGRDRDTATG